MRTFCLGQVNHCWQRPRRALCHCRAVCGGCDWKSISPVFSMGSSRPALQHPLLCPLWDANPTFAAANGHHESAHNAPLSSGVFQRIEFLNSLRRTFKQIEEVQGSLPVGQQVRLHPLIIIGRQRTDSVPDLVW